MGFFVSIEVCILASMREHRFDSYNVGANDLGTMRETLENLCNYANSGSKIYSLPMAPIEIIMNVTSKLGLSPLGPYHALMYGRSLYFDISKIKKELGFTPKYSTNQMFEESYDWYVNSYRDQQKSSNSNTSLHKKPAREAILKVLRWIS